jgi:hypothetical protein
MKSTSRAAPATGIVYWLLIVAMVAVDLRDVDRERFFVGPNRVKLIFR